ncbi:MAG: hypothetical protein US04_C0001G0713 [Candidatus Nomurabacteria bacterium GW2011_GWD2_36_14]|nr:MAG: hypothetical protein US04_C0001G0713 [Candidatus Nomurabacteria bacterium GW2011_GWD2_36_14]
MIKNTLYIYKMMAQFKSNKKVGVGASAIYYST